MTDNIDRISTSSVYVIDGDAAACGSLEVLLTSAGFPVRCFASGYEFLEAASSLPPGCVVSDIRMPEIDSVALLDRLLALGLNFPAVVITGRAEVEVAVRAMKAGAVDFIEKPFQQETLLDGVQRALQRLNAARVQDAAARTARDRLALLTERERGVLNRLVTGFPNKAIAYDLSISPRTVEVHRARIMSKMRARSLAELVRLALAAGCDPTSVPPSSER